MLKNLMHSASRNRFNEGSRQAMEPARPLVESRPESPSPAIKPAPREEGNKLIVGPNIKLKGTEITDCQILVVEGRVEASMSSRDIRISEGGVFSGQAEIDVAEVRGVFEGELTARKQLVIYASGKVTGKIRYGALTIEEGGSISGDVAAIVRAPQSAPALTIAEPEKAESIPSVLLPKLGHVHASTVLGRTPLGGRRS